MRPCPVIRQGGAELVIRAPVAQLDRALASGAKGCWFEPSQAYQKYMVGLLLSGEAVAAVAVRPDGLLLAVDFNKLVAAGDQNITIGQLERACSA